MRGPEKLLENENHWETRMGGWFAGERVVYRGQDLHVDLGDMSWIELYLYGITGRRFTEAQLEVLNAIWVYCSFPEPRIWPNRVAALAGTARSTGVSGIGAAIAMAEANLYGRRAGIRAMDFLIKTSNRIEKGSKLSEIMDRVPIVYGYGRPISQIDERIPHLMRKLKNVGMDQGKHVLLVFEIEKILLERRSKLYLNYGGFIAAVAADMGFTPREFYLFSIPMLIAGMTPCFIDAAEKHEGTFFPLRCGCIVYEAGMTRRSWHG